MAIEFDFVPIADYLLLFLGLTLTVVRTDSPVDRSAWEGTAQIDAGSETRSRPSARADFHDPGLPVMRLTLEKDGTVSVLGESGSQCRVRPGSELDALLDALASEHQQVELAVPDLHFLDLRVGLAERRIPVKYVLPRASEEHRTKF